MSQYLDSTIYLYKFDGTLIEEFNLFTGVGSKGGSSSISGMVLTLDPNDNLDYNTGYNVHTGTKSIKTSQNDYTIPNNIIWNFTTESASSTSTSIEEEEEEEEEETKLDHRVTVDGVTTRVVSYLTSAITAKLANGGFRTTAGHIDIGGGYYILAVADTTPDGKTTTRFLKVNEVDPNDVTLIGYTYSEGTPFAPGTLITIEKIDCILYIVIDSPINGTQLTVQ